MELGEQPYTYMHHLWPMFNVLTSIYMFDIFWKVIDTCYQDESFWRNHYWPRQHWMERRSQQSGGDSWIHQERTIASNNRPLHKLHQTASSLGQEK